MQVQSESNIYLQKERDACSRNDISVIVNFSYACLVKPFIAKCPLQFQYLYYVDHVLCNFLLCAAELNVIWNILLHYYYHSIWLKQWNFMSNFIDFYKYRVLVKIFMLKSVSPLYSCTNRVDIYTRNNHILISHWRIIISSSPCNICKIMLLKKMASNSFTKGKYSPVII